MRDYKQILLERLETRERCKTDLVFRLRVLRRCYTDTLYWFDMFAWTLDPRHTPTQIPLIPYQGKQIQYIQYLDNLLENPKDVFIDKPRDVGATVIFSLWCLKQFLFRDGFNARLGSRKEDYVDKTGDPDTLFYKIDFALQKLPKWMLPTRWSNQKNRSHMRLDRPDNSNTIVGESSNPSFARGGRQTIVLFDEIGFWSWAKPAWESAGDVTNIRVAMTTPPDTGRNSFAWKLLSGQAGTVERFNFDYTDIPWKDAEWLKDQKKRRSDEEFQREINKSYSSSMKGTVYAEDWISNVYEGDEIDYDPELPLFTTWDFGLDAVSMIWLQKDLKTEKVYLIDSYTNSDKTIDFYIPFVTGRVVSGVYEYSKKELEKIRLHRDWRSDITHFGDPDVKKQSVVTKNSAKDVLQKQGIYIQSKGWGGRTHYDMREKTKLMLRRLEVNTLRNEYMIECIKSARYPESREGSQSTAGITKPIHDWTSHYRSALEYFADNEGGIKINKKIRKKGIKQAYRPLGGI